MLFWCFVKGSWLVVCVLVCFQLGFSWFFGGERSVGVLGWSVFNGEFLFLEKENGV